MGFIEKRVRRARQRARKRTRETLRNAAERWCPDCQKRVQPFHLCAPKSDFKQQKAAVERRRKTEQRRRHRKEVTARRKARAAERRKAKRGTTRTRRPRENHPYQSCADMECPRPLCKAFKEGIQACPLSHG